MDTDHRSQFSVNSQIQMGILFRKYCEFFFHAVRNHTMFIFEDKMSTSDDYFMFIYHCGYPMCNNVFYFRMHLFVGNIPLFGGINHSLRHRMWKMFFQAGCNTEQFFLRTIAECFDFCNRWLCLGQCTGLVKYNSICLCNCFQEFATFYRDIIQTCFPDRRKYADRHRQFQRTGKIYHQYRQCLCHIPCDQIGQTCASQCIRNQTVCQMFCFSFHIRLEFFGLFDHGNDLFKLTSTVDFLDTDGQFALFDHGSGICIFLYILLNWNRFSGK